MSDLFDPLGSIVVSFAQLELTVRCVLMELFPELESVRRRAWTVTEGLTMRQNLDRIIQVGKTLLAGSLKDDVTDWAGDVGAAARQRNDLLHGHWADGMMIEGGKTIGPGTSSIKRGAIAWTPEMLRSISARGSSLSVSGLWLVEELRTFALRDVEREPLMPWERAADAPLSRYRIEKNWPDRP